MISAIMLLMAPVVDKQYSFCGLSADTADELAQIVLNATDLTEETGTAQWRVRSNNRDTIWSIGLPEKGGPHAVVCRYIVPNPNGPGSMVDMEIACDGTDAVCDKVRDDLVAYARALP
jgi:hypothetical protein